MDPYVLLFFRKIGCVEAEFEETARKFPFFQASLQPFLSEY